MHLLKLCFRREVEVESVVETPLFNVWSTHTAHVLAHKNDFSQCLKVWTSIYVQKSDFRVESHAHNFLLCYENAADESFRHIHNQLQVIAWDVRAGEIFIQ